MNEKFLNKLFKLYSSISLKFAKSELINKFLVSSYIIHKNLLYPYQYIDFEMWYRLSMKNKFSLCIEKKHVIDYINLNTRLNTEIALFLFELNNKIKSDLQLITEKDVLQLNEYYKRIL